MQTGRVKTLPPSEQPRAIAMQQTPRDKIIDRCRKLSRMTIANGASEAEAAKAAQVLSALLTEHQVNDTELSLRRDSIGMVCDSFAAAANRRSAKQEWERVAEAIARLFHLQGYYQYTSQDLYGLGIPTSARERTFYGYPEDVAAGIALLTICHNAMITAAERQPKRQQESFEAGMACRLAERILEIHAARTPPAGKALMVLKDQLVVEEFAAYLKRKGIGLYSHRRFAAPQNATAFANGQRAANSVGLNADQRLYLGYRQQ